MASISFEEAEIPIMNMDNLALQAHVRAQFVMTAFGWEEEDATFLGAGHLIDIEVVRHVFAFLIRQDEHKRFTFPRMVGATAIVDRNFTVSLQTGRNYYVVTNPGDKWHFIGVGNPNLRTAVNLITTPHFLEHEIPVAAGGFDGAGVYLICKPGNTYYLRLLPNDQQARVALLDTNLPIPAEPNHQLWRNVGQLHEIILQQNQSYQINIHGNLLATGNLLHAILFIHA